jgi:hypothetical protein
MLPPEVGTKTPCCIQQAPGAASRFRTAADVVAIRQPHTQGSRPGRPGLLQHAVMTLPPLLLQIGEALAQVLGDSGFRRRSAPHLATIILLQGEGVIPEGALYCPSAGLLNLHTSALPHTTCQKSDADTQWAAESSTHSSTACCPRADLLLSSTDTLLCCDVTDGTQ